MVEKRKGLAVDSEGNPVIDPTENVLALVVAAVKRQDDLRIAAEKFMEAELTHVRLTEALRAEHSRELNDKESNRLDAIRQVDVQNGNAAAAAAADAIRVLAATTAANAEKLRTDLNATAATMAKQTADVAATMAAQQAGTVAGITERIAALEKSSYEGIGKGRVADPMMAEFMTDMKSMLRAQSQNTGKNEGVNSAWVILLGAVSLISALAAAGSFIYSATRATTAPVPIIVQVPAAATATGTAAPTK
jgi:hypothetical protein